MVDKEKMRRKIQYIEENKAKLEQLKELSVQELSDDFRNIEAAKHLLQVAIEAMIDIANHIIARNRWPTPGTSFEALQTLKKHGYFDSNELELFAQMIKFRNRVVHLYHEVDNDEIHKILQKHLGDFSLFVRAVSKKLF